MEAKEAVLGGPRIQGDPKFIIKRLQNNVKAESVK